MNKEELLKEHGADRKARFGSDGWVYVVDVMGDDSAITQAARISYGDGTKSVREDRDLIRYLWRCQHGSPFEMADIKLHVRLPIYLMRMLVRYRMASINEYSMRYSEAIDSMEFIPSERWRGQSTENKQGSAGDVQWPEDKYLSDNAIKWKHAGAEPGAYLTSRQADIQDEITTVYNERRAFGVAREQARMEIPVSNYTEIYWKINARSLLHFIHQRMDSHAQPEIQVLAHCLASIVEDWLPETWSAFEDYTLNAMTFSAGELKALMAEMIDKENLQHWLNNMGQESKKEFLTSHGLESKSERIDFWKKMKHLLE